MKSNRFISDHPEFGAFLKKELKQLDIRREAFRSTCHMSREIRLLKIDRAMFREECHMSQSYLEDIKKGSIIMR